MMPINLGFVLNIIDDLKERLSNQDYINCMNTLRDANKIIQKHEEKLSNLWSDYYELRDEYDLLIVSDEIGKSKPASLFFLSKFGCLLEKIIFYSETTKNDMWDNVDILITSNPDLILNKPEDKIVVKFLRDYNKNIKSELEISTLSDFNLLLKKITKEYV